MDSKPSLVRGLDAWLRRTRFAALRDVVEKRPAEGTNLDALDGIRGVAVLIVVASHTDGLGLEGHGGAGVWLFFGLSAFLLTRPFAADPSRARRAASLR
ncbi:MAG: hypothetical protein MJE66_20480, partial [Proteobacteria bacterium]|nr:hypothetical protein [Pseudomonadota bacterium]